MAADPPADPTAWRTIGLVMKAGQVVRNDGVGAMTAGADGAVTALIDDLRGGARRRPGPVRPPPRPRRHDLGEPRRDDDARRRRAHRLPRRTRRAGRASTLVSLTADDKLVEVFDGVALARYRSSPARATPTSSSASPTCCTTTASTAGGSSTIAIRPGGALVRTRSVWSC